jgi:hypothetical protein
VRLVVNERWVLKKLLFRPDQSPLREVGADGSDEEV